MASGVLAIALIALGVMYQQRTSELDDARAYANSLGENIAVLENSIASLNAQIAAEKAAVAQLQTLLDEEKTGIASLEADLLAAQQAVAEAEAETTAAEADVEAAQASVAAIQAELDAAKASVIVVETQLAQANTKIAVLEQANAQIAVLQDQNAALEDDLAALRSPRHFASLAELQLWLAIDDTNYAYPDLDSIDRAFILQVKAARDGLIISTHIQPAGLTGIFLMAVNYAVVVDNDVYRIDPDTDAISVLFQDVSYSWDLYPTP
jgi:predicted  nucleic acid-binding Zn-ribbon protein